MSGRESPSLKQRLLFAYCKLSPFGHNFLHLREVEKPDTAHWVCERCEAHYIGPYLRGRCSMRDATEELDIDPDGH